MCLQTLNPDDGCSLRVLSVALTLDADVTFSSEVNHGALVLSWNANLTAALRTKSLAYLRVLKCDTLLLDDVSLRLLATHARHLVVLRIRWGLPSEKMAEHLRYWPRLYALGVRQIARSVDDRGDGEGDVEGDVKGDTSVFSVLEWNIDLAPQLRRLRTVKLRVTKPGAWAFFFRTTPTNRTPRGASGGR